MNIIQRAQAYVAKMDPAVEGSGGRIALFKVARVLVFEFDLQESEAMPIFVDYNSRCLPPFSERELTETLANAKKKCKGERGRLAIPSSSHATRNTSSTTRSRSALKPNGSNLRHMQNRPAADELAEKRAKWPELRDPDDGEIQKIADLRGIRKEAVKLLASRQVLMTCTYQLECFAFCGKDQTFRQIRHLDGSPFLIGNRETRKEKALALPGSRGHWIDEVGAMNGATSVPPGSPVIIVEGVVGLLEAVEARMRANDLSQHPSNAWIIARVSANHPATAGLLRSMEGRRVRILADNDTSGKKSASELHVMLKSSGAFPEIVLPPIGKDLGDTIKGMPADAPFWLQLFTF